jgi:hypothetical protein
MVAIMIRSKVRINPPGVDLAEKYKGKQRN